jgi:hypothetical protein
VVPGEIAERHLADILSCAAAIEARFVSDAPDDECGPPAPQLQWPRL